MLGLRAVVLNFVTPNSCSCRMDTTDVLDLSPNSEQSDGHQTNSSKSGVGQSNTFMPPWDTIALQEVLWEKVSLKLPPSSLATFRAVCKRWKALVVLPLNPTLWKTLPEEVLERVVSKVPFASLATFRAVSKRWNTFIIPRAVAAAGLRVQSSGTSALIYFEPHKFDGPLRWWLQVCNSKGAWSSAQVEFPMCWSFPTPKLGETVWLIASDGGLLFFGIIELDSDLVQEFVVCNPLTGQSKRLLAPYRLEPPVGTPFLPSMVDVGVVCNAERGSYNLVVAGLDCPTLVYDSLSCAWKSTAPMPLEDGEKVLPRSVSCNGNLYWCVQFKWPLERTKTSVLKYDLQDDSWRRFRGNEAFTCGEDDFVRSRFYTRIGLHKGKVLLSHLHQPVHRFLQDDVRVIDSVCRVWMWESFVSQMGPEAGLICWTMLEAVEKFLRKPFELAEEFYEYLSFGQNNLFYTVMLSRLLNEDGEIEFMRNLVHNSDDNSQSELPVVRRERQSFRSHNQVLRTSFLWAYFPSLNAMP